MSAQTDLLRDTVAGKQALATLVEKVLDEARSQGVSAAEADVSVGQGLSVTVRLGEVETVEHNRDKNLGLTVFFGHKSASASTSDFSAAAIRDTVRAACSIAKYTAADECAGLADSKQLAKDPPDLDLHHPWNLSAEVATAMARECEDAARGVDRRIKNSEGATVSSYDGLEVYGNTNGFFGAIPASRQGLS